MRTSRRCAFALFYLAIAMGGAAQEPSRHAQTQELDNNLVRGRLLDPDGQPVGGAFVDLLRCDADGFACGDREYRARAVRITRAPTRDDGSFTMHAPRGLPCRLSIEVEPFARLLRYDVFGGDEVTLRLVRGRSLRVDVRGADRAPLDEAIVRVLDSDSFVEVGRAVTDADGSVGWDRIAGDGWIVVVEPRFDAPPPWEWIRPQGSGAATTQLLVQVPPAENWSCRVVSADDGKPIEGASIGHGHVQQGLVRSLADGTFTLGGFSTGRRDHVRVTAKGYAAVEVRRGTTLGDVRLSRGVTVRGRLVLTAGGRPTDGYVAAIGASHDEFDRLDWLPARIADDGEFVIEGLRREPFRYVVMLRHENHGTSVLCVPSLVGRDEFGLGAVELGVRRVLAGRLGDRLGRARRHERLALVGSVDGHERFVDAGTIEQHTMSYATRRFARADGMGRFWFGDLAPGSYSVMNGLDAGIANVEVHADRDPPWLELRR